MNIKILSVGKTKDRDLEKKIKGFSERVSHDAKLVFVEIKDAGVVAEAGKILGHLEKDSGHVIALDERGREFTSAEFASHLARIPGKITFVIGGPSGLCESVKKRSHELLALSKMTFTHEMAKMLLAEQIYRALSIIHNRKYHKE